VKIQGKHVRKLFGGLLAAVMVLSMMPVGGNGMVVYASETAALEEAEPAETAEQVPEEPEPAPADLADTPKTEEESELVSAEETKPESASGDVQVTPISELEETQALPESEEQEILDALPEAEEITVENACVAAALMNSEISVAEVTFPDGTSKEYSYSDDPAAAYATAAAAMKAAWEDAGKNSGADAPATIKLLKDVDLGEDHLTVNAPNSNIILTSDTDGNDHTYTLSGSQRDYGTIYMENGQLTLESGTIKNTSGTAQCIHLRNANARPVFKITGGTVETNMLDNPAYYNAVIYSYHGDIIIEGGTIRGNYCVSAERSEITMTGGLLELGDTGVIGVRIDNASSFTMSGGTIEASAKNGKIFKQGVSILGSGEGASTFHMTGGEINGGYGVSVGMSALGGTCTIEGGTITANSQFGVLLQLGSARISGDAKIQAISKYGHAASYGLIADGSSEVIIEGNAEVSGPWAAGASGNGRLTVNGGTITGTSASGYGLFIDSSNSALTVTGGTISGPRSGLYAKEGAVALSGGTYTGTQTSIRTDIPGKTVEDLLADGYSYFAGTAIAEEQKIKDAGVLAGTSLSSDDGYGTVIVGQSPFTVTSQEQDQEKEYGYTGSEAPSFAVDVQGATDAVAYQWYQKGENGTDTLITGATAAAYAPPQINKMHAGTYKYYCIVSRDGYEVVSDTFVLTIQPKEIKAVVTAQDKVYDGTAAANVTVTADTGVTGETVTITGLTGSFADASAGDGKAVTVDQSGVGIVFGGTAKESDYKVTIPGQVTAAISPRPVTISGITAENKVYDGSSNASFKDAGVKYNGLVQGDKLGVTVSGQFEDANAGAGKKVTISGLVLTGESAGNYILADSGQQETVFADIMARDIKEADVKLGAALTANGRLQTQELQKVTVKTADGRELDAAYTVTGNQGTEPGTYTMTITGTGNFTGTVTKTFVIAPRADNNKDKNKHHSGSHKSEASGSSDASGQAAQPSGMSATASPATGDSSNLWLWCAIMLISACGIPEMLICRKKNKRK